MENFKKLCNSLESSPKDAKKPKCNKSNRKKSQQFVPSIYKFNVWPTDFN